MDSNVQEAVSRSPKGCHEEGSIEGWDIAARKDMEYSYLKIEHIPQNDC
jgi:hypothetical protein